MPSSNARDERAISKDEDGDDVHMLRANDSYVVRQHITVGRDPFRRPAWNCDSTRSGREQVLLAMYRTLVALALLAHAWRNQDDVPKLHPVLLCLGHGDQSAVEATYQGGPPSARIACLSGSGHTRQVNPRWQQSATDQNQLPHPDDGWPRPSSTRLVVDELAGVVTPTRALSSRSPVRRPAMSR